MRPISIRRFGWTYLASIVTWLISLYVGWDLQIATFASNPTIGQSPQLIAMATLMLKVTSALGFIVFIAIWALVYFKASEVAKWMVTIFFVFSTVAMPLSLAGFEIMGPIITGLILVTYLLSAYAVWMLFRPDARLWFAGNGVDVAPSAD